MHIDVYDDGNHLVAADFAEEATCEELYMVGNGVRGDTTARGVTEEEEFRQPGHPFTFSACATAIIFQGLDKIIRDEEVARYGYFTMTPQGARQLLVRLTMLDISGIEHADQFLAETA